MAATSSSGYSPSPPLLHRETRDSISTAASLRLGPVGKSKTFIESYRKPVGYENSKMGGATDLTPTVSPAHIQGHPKQYPRIIVRDPLGRTLDTFTALQEAIYRASWTRKKMGEWPKTQLEWRLPKAPSPSRPDYTRAGPRSMTSLESPGTPRGGMITRNRDVSPITTHSSRRVDYVAETEIFQHPTLEIAVDDVAFVAESLNHLPALPSFSFLRHSLLAGRSTYVQIVASILLHQKQLKEKDQREAEWTFPGFCSGCKRAGFCYGCSKNPRPHVHEDIPARTGGGFRFWKHDRPRDPQQWKIPTNWKLPSSAQELRNLIEKYGGIGAYEQAMVAARQEMALKKYDMSEQIMSTTGSDSRGRSRSSRFQRLKNLGTYPPYVTIVSTDEYDRATTGTDDDGEGEEEEEEEDEHASHGASTYRRTRVTSRSRKSKSGVSSYAESGHTRSRASSSDGVLNSETMSERTYIRVDTGFEDGESETDYSGRPVRPSIGESSTGGATSRSRSRHISPESGTQRTRSLSKDHAKTSPDRTKTGRLQMPDKLKEAEEEEEARIRRERAKANVPFGKKRKDVLYKAPKFFKVHKSQKRTLVAKDPFSTDRVLDVPKGGTFQLKKSEKKATKFVDFKKSDRGWEAPKKFEIKQGQTKPTTFWKPPKSKQGDDDGSGKKRRGGEDNGSRRRRLHDLSPDSGLESGTGDKEDGSKDLNKGDGDDGKNAGDGQGDQSGLDAESKGPKRREIVKKVRQEKPPKPETPPGLPDPPQFKKRTPPPPTPSPPRTPTPVDIPEPELPELDLPTVPDLPDIVDKQPEKRKEKLKFAVEPPPSLKEGQKKLRQAPKVRILPKVLSRPRKSRPAKAPVTSEELMDIQDPLDFLAKYCIINPDRLPFYEIIFESTVADQEPKYQKKSEEEKAEKEAEETEEEGKKKKKKGKSKKSDKDKEDKDINPSMFATDRGMYLEKTAMTLEEQHLEKLIYTLDMLHDKMTLYGSQLEQLEEERIHLLASRAKDMFPEVAQPDYFPKKKGKKKGKKGKSSPPPRKLRPEEITDDVIVARLDGKMLMELSGDQDMKNRETEMERLKEKIRDIQARVESIASEKLLTDAFCMNHYFMRQGWNNPPEDFKRQQSELYNRLHPTPDVEMNLEEVEGALQQINNHLITEKEFFFLYNILNLPGRERINFRLFCIIAALSEKVSQLDPVIRKMINNFNYNALDIKMEKCKELFDLLESEHMPKGGAQASSLAVELTAGGLRPEHTNYVLHKFNRENKGVVDFLDFVTYVPLFVEIHKRIIHHPLSSDHDL